MNEQAIAQLTALKAKLEATDRNFSGGGREHILDEVTKELDYEKGQRNLAAIQKQMTGMSL